MNQALQVGLMVPNNNTTMEKELLYWLPAGSGCVTQRIPRGKGLLDARTLPEYLNEALRLAPVFDQPQIDVVAYGCTAAGFISGPAGDAALQQNLAKITRKNVVTTAHSMVQALQEKGIKKIALVTPYLEGVNVQLKAFLAEGGVEVLSFNSFYAQNTDELGMISSAQVAQMARQTMREDCEALFIGCSQLPTCEILPDLEREWGRPVLSSIQVTAHFALQAVQSAKGFV
ncbi:MAG: aspartate/glutamate racemase family protein [Betaproteobacteria bacterium]